MIWRNDLFISSNGFADSPNELAGLLFGWARWRNNGATSPLESVTCRKAPWGVFHGPLNRAHDFASSCSRLMKGSPRGKSELALPPATHLPPCQPFPGLLDTHRVARGEKFGLDMRLAFTRFRPSYVLLPPARRPRPLRRSPLSFGRCSHRARSRAPRAAIPPPSPSW